MRVSTKDFDPDALAFRLWHMGEIARQMSPSWDALGMSVPVLGEGGVQFGRVMPGRGVYVDADLHRVGIRKAIPRVFQRSAIARLMDKLNDERGAVSYQDVLDARANGQSSDAFHFYNPANFASNVAWGYAAGTNSMLNLCPSSTAPTSKVLGRNSNSQAGEGPNPGTGATVEPASMPELHDPPSGKHKFICQLGYGPVVLVDGREGPGLAILVDALVGAGKFRGTVTTLETDASPTAVTRQYGPSGNLGAGAQLVVLNGNPTRSGLSANTWTINYHNSSNVSSSSTQQPSTVITGSAGETLRLNNQTPHPFWPLGSGDVGVRQIDSTQKNTTADSTGYQTLQIVQPLAFLPGYVNVYTDRNPFMGAEGLIPLGDASGTIGGINMLVQVINGNTIGQMMVHLGTVDLP